MFHFNSINAKPALPTKRPLGLTEQTAVRYHILPLRLAHGNAGSCHGNASSASKGSLGCEVGAEMVEGGSVSESCNGSLVLLGRCWIDAGLVLGAGDGWYSMWRT